MKLGSSSCLGLLALGWFLAGCPHLASDANGQRGKLAFSTLDLPRGADGWIRVRAASAENYSARRPQIADVSVLVCHGCTVLGTELGDDYVDVSVRVEDVPEVLVDLVARTPSGRGIRDRIRLSARYPEEILVETDASEPEVHWVGEPARWVDVSYWVYGERGGLLAATPTLRARSAGAETERFESLPRGGISGTPGRLRVWVDRGGWHRVDVRSGTASAAVELEGVIETRVVNARWVLQGPWNHPGVVGPLPDACLPPPDDVGTAPWPCFGYQGGLELELDDGTKVVGAASRVRIEGEGAHLFFVEADATDAPAVLDGARFTVALAATTTTTDTSTFTLSARVGELEFSHPVQWARPR